MCPLFSRPHFPVAFFTCPCDLAVFIQHGSNCLSGLHISCPHPPTFLLPCPILPSCVPHFFLSPSFSQIPPLLPSLFQFTPCPFCLPSSSSSSLPSPLLSSLPFLFPGPPHCLSPCLPSFLPHLPIPSPCSPPFPFFLFLCSPSLPYSSFIQLQFPAF